jgi:hypothetical protein
LVVDYPRNRDLHFGFGSKGVGEEKVMSACCARCIKPMKGEKVFKVGRFTYGECCILKVLEKNPDAKVEEKSNAA